MTPIEWMLWCSCGLAAWSFVGYPLLSGLLSVVLSHWDRHRAAGTDSNDSETTSWPTVSLLISTRGELRTLLQTLKTLTILDYPDDRLQILIYGPDDDLVSDLVSAFHDHRVRFVRVPPGNNEMRAFWTALAEASGEIVVRSDATVTIDPLAIRRLAARFNDPRVGAVSGRALSCDPDSATETVGQQFRELLLRNESRMGAIPVLEPLLNAFRRRDIPEFSMKQLPADCLAPGDVIHRHGLHVAYEPMATAWREDRLGGTAQDRIPAGSRLTSFRSMMQRLDPRRPRLAFVVASRLVIQRFWPVYLLIAMFSNIILSPDHFYMRLLLLHELIYLAVCIGFVIHYRRRPVQTSESARARRRAVARTREMMAFSTSHER